MPIQNVRIVTCHSGASELDYCSKHENLVAMIRELSYRCDNDVVLGHHHLHPPQILQFWETNVDIKLSPSGSHHKGHVITPTVILS